MSDYNARMKPFRDSVALEYAAKNIPCLAVPFVYPYVQHSRLSKVIRLVKETAPFVLGKSTGLAIPAQFPLKNVLHGLVKARAREVDTILQHAIDHPSLPTTTGMDEEATYAEYLFYAFIFVLPLGYNDELFRCFHACLRWAAEPIVRVRSPAADLALNNYAMSGHRGGAVAASGSGNMVEHVEPREAELPGVMEADSMDMDEGDEEEVEEEEEEEPEPVEDDNKLWPVPSRPSQLRDFWRKSCWNAIHTYLVTTVTEVQYSKAQLTTASAEVDLYDRLWEEAEECVNENETTPEGQDLHRRLEPYVEKRITYIEYRRFHFGTRYKEGLEAWAERVADRVSEEQIEAYEAEERAEAARNAERAAARNRALARRLAAQAREQQRRTLVKAGRERRLAEGKVLMQLKRELRDLEAAGSALRKEDRDLVSERKDLIPVCTRRGEIAVRQEEISLALWFNKERQRAKTAEIETHRANVALEYERERTDINRLTPRHRLLKRGRR